MYQFFVDPSQISGTRIIITGTDVNHIRHVLRMKPGEEISVSNGADGKEYRCGIDEIREDAVLCTLRFVKEDGLELPARITLFQGLPKADKMELIIQKAVELGASEIVPVACKRSVVRLDPKKEKSKLVRWQGISEAAAKQSKRRIIPVVREVMTMEQAISCAAQMDIKLIPYELAADFAHTRDMISSIRTGQSVAVFIGPEGGFDEMEVTAAKAGKIEPVTLGKRILRTETAGFTVLSWIMYHLESDEI